MEKLFPPDIVKSTAESHFSRFDNRSQIIYIALLLFLMGGILMLFGIKTDITVQSRGIIRSSIEPVRIAAPVAAEVFGVNLHENGTVMKGDTLIWLNNEKIQKRRRHLESLIADNRAYIADIQAMKNSTHPELKTDLIRTTHSRFMQKLSEYEIDIQLQKKLFNRSLRLFQKEVIPLAEKEEREFQLKKVLDTRDYFLKQSRYEWQRRVAQYQLENKKFQNEINELSRESENYIIPAPATGIISNFSGIKPGSYVSPGQTIAVISSADSIIAESHISPQDVGLLQEGMPVTFQIDAYNYHQWGLASGEITEISKTIYLINNEPFFRIQCSIHESFLKLKNGYKGRIKKGLTTTIRYKIAKRTLAQLLFDRADNWLNPRQNNLQKNQP